MDTAASESTPHWRRLIITLSIIVCTTSIASAQQPRYRIVNLDERGPATILSHAHGITIVNDEPHVVGLSYGLNGAAYWPPQGPAIKLGVPGVNTQEARAINSVGYAVGSYFYSGSDEQAVRWHVSGATLDLASLGGSESWAYDINDNMDIVGRCESLIGDGRPCLWDVNNTVQDLGSGSQPIGVAYAINEFGEAAGSVGNGSNVTIAAVWTGGTIFELTLGSPGNNSLARDINDAGDVVGFMDISTTERHAFLWNVSQGITDLGAIHPRQSTYASAVNENQVVVGWFNGGIHREGAFLWKDGIMYNLQDSLVNEQDDWLLFLAWDIDDRGPWPRVVGWGWHKSNGETAFLLEPALTIASVVPAQAGQTNEITITGATPWEDVVVVYGRKRGKTQAGFCPGAELDLVPPIERLPGVYTADGDGNVTVQLNVPSRFAGSLVRMQAVDLSNCQVSNLAEEQF